MQPVVVTNVVVAITVSVAPVRDFAVVPSVAFEQCFDAAVALDQVSVAAVYSAVASFVVVALIVVAGVYFAVQV